MLPSFPHTGPNAQVFELILEGRIRPCITAAVIEEYHQVFEYERLQNLDKRRIAKLQRYLEDAAIKVKSASKLRVSIHEEDNRIYECAAAAKAHYIVTENIKHFPDAYKYTKIVTARQLLRLVQEGRV